MRLGPRLRRALFGISPAEGDLARRGFAATSAAARTRLEAIARTFIDGYNASLAETNDELLPSVDPELRGFSVEGEAMGAALLDHLTPWRRDGVRALLERRSEHVYMIHVGTGWATARLRASLSRAIARRDPLLGWLVADGWGFHQAYFHPRRWAHGRAAFRVDRCIARVVDQGIGRALWFVAGADPARVAEHVSGFTRERHADLWSGIGLAATYAGGVDRDALESVRRLARDHRGSLAQGAAFAATARVTAANVVAHVELAARTFTGQTASELASLTNASRPSSPVARSGDAYEAWRTRIREALARSEAA